LCAWHTSFHLAHWGPASFDDGAGPLYIASDMSAQDRKDDVDARNREFLRYDQVDKVQDYRLAEAAGTESFDDAFVVRTIDLGRFAAGDDATRRAIADELGAALREIGFAILVNTGVDSATYDTAEEHVSRMFETTPLERKLAFRAARVGAVNQGYFPIEETSDIHPDLVEGWVFCRRAFVEADQDAFWPDVAAARFFRGHAARHEALIRPVGRALMLALGQDEESLDTRLDGTDFAVRLNYYPPIDERAAVGGAGRLLGHEDVTLFTMLPAPSIEGLQVLNRANMKWVRLTAPRGALILNTGDYMQRISNDVFPSTTHRVSKPRDPAAMSRARASFPMNVYLRADDVLEVLPGLGDPKYAPIRAIEFHTRTTAKYYGDDYAVREGDS